MNNSHKNHNTNITSQILNYQIIQTIYDGNRTLVYQAIRIHDQLPVVIKLLKNEYPSFSELVQFRNQYTIAKNLNLPGIIQTYSLEAYQNSYALVMEDFGGISLKQWVEQGETSPDLSDFLQMAIDISNILYILGHHRIIHKDIKPANILINPQTKQVKLIDFSIASLLPRETLTISNPNALDGTLGYLSPEQTGRMNRGIDYRTDFYSLGVTFYELLAGELPFQSRDAMELVHCHIAKQPPLLHEVNPQIPQVVSSIVSKLMAKNAEDRYHSALGLKFDLEFCLSQLQESGEIENFAIGSRDLCDRFIIPEKLYGRETEIETLLQAFERVADPLSSGGQRGAEMMLVAGFSGIGKTVVVNEIHKPIVRQHGYFIKGKFDQFNRNIPFSALVQAFRDLMGQLLSESDEKLEKWQTQILQALGDNGQVIVEVIPELEKIIGQQSPAIELSGTAAQNRFNLLFQNFIKIFTAKEHPLVIFLDDLQWADSASLQLMQLLMSESEISYLLVIGAYRDNEVSPAHPLMLTLDTVVKAGATVNTIALQPLSSESLNHLVADTLNCAPDLARPLTDLVAQKTQGNPFFATQFLKALYQDRLINFTPPTPTLLSSPLSQGGQRVAAGGWQCDLVGVRAAALTEDVVEFMALQLQKLPPATQNVLKLAACIGNQFDLGTLAIISEQLATETAADLWNALQEGLILPETEIYKFYLGAERRDEAENLEVVNYKFLHDRVQQAAYSLIPESQEQSVHLQIGRLLLANKATSGDEQIFALVNQLNRGLKLIESGERETIARLNLQAGIKANTSTAYKSAVDYLLTSVQLLNSDAWESQYSLSLEISNQLALAAFLAGDFEQMEQTIDRVINHARSLLEQVTVYEIKIQALILQGQSLVAVKTALLLVEKLGIKFPANPTTPQVLLGLAETKIALLGKSIQTLENQPAMTAPNIIAVTQILAKTLSAAYISAPDLMPLMVFRKVNLFVKYGNTSLAAFTYAWYGLILCGVVRDIKTGYQFGELALKLLDKFDAKEIKCRVLFIIYYFVFCWKNHLNDTIAPLLISYQSGLETGDTEYAAWAVLISCANSYYSGHYLAEVNQKLEFYTESIAKLNQEAAELYCKIFHQTTLNLLGDGEAAALEGEVYCLSQRSVEQQANSDKTGLFFAYTNQATLRYLFGDFALARQTLLLARQYEDGGIASPGLVVFYFYDSLTCLAELKQANPSEKHDRLKQVARNQKKMKNWAYYAPMNYQHKWCLIEAERYRTLNKLELAIEMYDRAIAGAKANEYIQEEALANELAAKFYLDWGKEKVAAGYMQEAYYCYAKWGAKAKIDDLEERYPQLLVPILQAKQNRSANVGETRLQAINNLSMLHQTIQTIKSSSNISEALDLAAILKASQALSSEIELEKLLAALMSVVIENAGATKAVLLLLKDGNLSVETVACLKENVISMSVPLSLREEVPAAAVNYVKRTLTTVVLNNTSQNDFMSDPYLMDKNLKSLLCAPILHQGKLIGLLYLENNLTIEAFTGDRTEVIQMLCAQVAISLENARLYQQSQAYGEELERSLVDLQQAQLQIVQSEKMSALGNLVAGVAHEINNPIGFINGNIDEATMTIKDIIEHLKLYQEKFPNPGAEIQQDAEDIDLEYILVDLPKMLSSMKVGCNRIRGISTSLRTFSRADKDYKVPFKIHEGIDSTILILKHRLKANEYRPQIEVLTDYGNLPKIECFPGQLNQVFMNLLANAIDALEDSNQGRSFAEIEANPNRIVVRIGLEGDRHIKITIADNGAGMTESMKQRIFDHLFTTKAVGKGTGLGLAIARQIVVETHGGTIDVNSHQGEGTEFVIVLPISEQKLQPFVI
ncbi:AAA family ATPase [Tychonema sp. LEGE 07199]|uniref:trifunctional serine/threonine-protein kinase/ATP-binding protein/sensor histidine kinase n=1 Tax=unclassified Tychonema TaxID=2642144 RepID=UPI00188066C3|nr:MULTISPECIES: ATP-binding sensor histidine kinase [unclassified Tychonema]MBE9119275.1 AAA family ATPase [Tychonema sp. LEGE 07199]MBE9130902.1 AAA family ATPase [Tychonema sp. LEGE 07196]